MGLDIGNAVNRVADWVCETPIIRGVVNNPVFTALLIVAIIVVIAMALYSRDIKRNGVKRALRFAVYCFLAVLTVTFIHHYAVKRDAQKSVSQKGIQDVFSSIEANRATGGHGVIPVLPTNYEGGGQDYGGARFSSRPNNISGSNNRRLTENSLGDDIGDLDIEDAVIPTYSAVTGSRP